MLQRREHLDRVVFPIGCRMQITAGGEAFGKRMHERRLQQPPLVMPLLRPGSGKNTCTAASVPGAIIRCNDVHGIVGDDAHVGELRAVDQSQQAADARRVHIDRQKIVIRLQRAMAAVVSPMPKPISRIFGFGRPNSPARSIGAGEYGMPKRGRSAS